jgi:hypothetical protein
LPILHPLQVLEPVQDPIATAVQVAPIVQKAMLAGHSQGSQIYLPFASVFWLSRRAVCFPEGWYAEPDSMAQYSRGIGNFFLPAGFWRPPELFITSDHLNFSDEIHFWMSTVLAPSRFSKSPGLVLLFLL